LKHNIEILSSQEIDKNKWNKLVNDCNNGLIYAQSDLLDSLADNWDAVIVGDYDAILPIPHRKKWGIRYSYTVPFVQQLGLIGNLEATHIAEIKSQIQKKFCYGTIQLNSGNLAIATQFGATPKTNMYLSLQQPFSVLEQTFKKEISRVSNKLITNNWSVKKNIPIKDCMHLFRRLLGHKLQNIKEQDFERLVLFCHENKNESLQYYTRAVVNPSGEICSVAVLLRDNKRIYNIINASTAEGKKTSANYLLYYECLKEFSELPLLFDFEGSSIPGIARFYNKFNPLKEFYFIWHYNALPFPLSLIP